MENLEILKKLGLTEKEAETYITLLKLGSVPAGPLIKELGMHRAAVYNLLDILINKGLVHFVIQANRKYFEAQDPKRLLELLESKKQELDEQESNLNNLITDLESQRKISTESQEGTVYKGKKGIKSIFEDILNYKGEDYQVMGASGKFKELFPFYFSHWQKRRAKEKIKLKIIYSDKLKEKHREKELKLAEIKYTKEQQDEPATTFIYGEKVVMIVWSDTPLAFLVRSKKVSDSYKSLFNRIWKTAKN